MKKIIRIFVIATIMTCGSTMIFAEETEQKPAPETTALQDAVFSIPSLTEESAKSITLALAEIEGITATKPDLENKKFSVTFDTQKLTKEKLEEAVKKSAADATLESVNPASSQAAKHDCGKCPSRKTCAKANNS